MINLITEYALNFLLLCGLSLVWGGLIFSLSLLMQRQLKIVAAWRNIWLAGCLCVLLPFVLGQFTVFQEKSSLFADLPFAELMGGGEVSQASGLMASSKLQLDNPTEWLLQLSLFWLAIYCIVAAMRLSRLAVGLRKLGKTLNSQHISQTPDTMSGFSQQQQSWLRTNHIRLVLTDGNTSPFVFGLFRRYLVIPRFVLEMPEPQRQLVIEHEITHLKQHDPELLIITRLMSCLLWFNTLYLRQQRAMEWAIELACDRQVVSQTPTPQRKLYAATMLQVLKQSTKQSPMSALSEPHSPWKVAFTPIAKESSQQQFVSRLGHIMKPARFSSSSLTRNLSLLAGGVLLSLVAGLLQPKLSFANVAPTQWIAPIETFRLTAQYGVVSKIHPKGHRGTDLAAPKGTTIVAIAGGTVVTSTDNFKHKNYGKVIVIDHGAGFQSFYSHMDQRVVETGQRINAGDNIGTVGTSGFTTGPHLHLEMLKDGQRVDPGEFIGWPAK